MTPFILPFLAEHLLWARHFSWLARALDSSEVSDFLFWPLTASSCVASGQSLARAESHASNGHKNTSGQVITRAP